MTMPNRELIWGLSRTTLCFERYTVEFCLKYGAGYGTRTRRLLLTLANQMLSELGKPVLPIES